MGILMLEPAAGDQHPGGDEGLDDRLVGVSLLALLGDDALAFKTRRIAGEAAIGIDGEGDGRIDPLVLEPAGILAPEVEVLAAMARRGVDEAGPGIDRDMLAGEERHGKVIPSIRERMS
jgi:hypothetical protein